MQAPPHESKAQSLDNNDLGGENYDAADLFAPVDHVQIGWCEYWLT